MRGKVEEVLSDLVVLKSSSEDDMGPIVRYVSDRLGKLGMKPRYYGKKKTPAIVASFKKDGVVLSGHLDTVPRGTGWKYEDGLSSDGFMYGRGSCDMKGGCTAMLLAAEALVAASTPFSLCFTTDEEVTMAGALASTKDPALKNAPAILVTEPTGFEIVHKEKGQLQLALSTAGKACHSSMPQLGDNAISKMVDLLSKLQDLQRIPPNPTTDMTLSMTTIKGGTRINVIPDSCETEIDIRYPAAMGQREVVQEIKKRIGAQGYGLRTIHNLDPVETDPNSPAIRILMELLGPSAEVTAVPYATEMVMFSKANKSVMICGPGDPKGCHIVDEKVEIAQVTKAAEIYIEYCSRMSGE
jgi:acetylornithine deacetylase/succinyl-diaminopimelate desuccinylase-like protein